MNGQPALAQPPWRENADGKPRRVGVELELSGLTLDRVAALVAGFTGTTVEAKGRYERTLDGDAAGEWIVELDFKLLKDLGREEYDPDTLAGSMGETAEDTLAWFAEKGVPVEIVSPPLPLDRLDDIERLIAELRDAGAKGTSDSLINAFGMQFNPEIPAEDPATLAAVLKAFLCLYEWVYARADINVARLATRYVNPFPAAYVRKVIDPAYRPDLPALIDDYLAHNPTRNRALDLLPLFAHLDADRVRAIVDDPLIKPRPTFHYRLPDCEIHLPGWGLHAAWNDWVTVERLAADTERLDACGAAYHAFLASLLKRWFGDWPRELESTWLDRS